MATVLGLRQLVELEMEVVLTLVEVFLYLLHNFQVEVNQHHALEEGKWSHHNHNLLAVAFVVIIDVLRPSDNLDVRFVWEVEEEAFGRTVVHMLLVVLEYGQGLELRLGLVLRKQDYFSKGMISAIS
jgi:hypothetical protein